MAFNPDVFPYKGYVAVWINEIGRSDDTIIFPSIPLFELPGPKFLQSLFFLIAQQGDCNIMFFDKLLVCLRGIRTHPKNNSSQFLEGLPGLAEICSLLGSALGVVLWIKIEDNP